MYRTLASFVQSQNTIYERHQAHKNEKEEAAYWGKETEKCKRRWEKRERITFYTHLIRWHAYWQHMRRARIPKRSYFHTHSHWMKQYKCTNSKKKTSHTHTNVQYITKSVSIVENGSIFVRLKMFLSFITL